MELATIAMPKHEARKAFIEYRGAVRQRHSEEDEQIMRAYRALSQGKSVININDAIRDGGEDEHGLPRLAISRADETEVRVRRTADGSLEFAPQAIFGWNGRRGAEYAGRKFIFSAGTLPARDHDVADFWQQQWFSIVPNVPPALRPPHALSGYQILFGAEWQRAPSRAPGDPALLKHLGGPLYAVLAVWDLTPIEQAVLGITRSR